ncbi:MAG TPA: hypothetical protein V6D05_12525 [Stenomitos sp.]
MIRSERTITNFKHPGSAIARPLSWLGKLKAVVLACAAAAASLVHPLLALGVVGLMLWQAFSPEP